jgi:hypothetical protein
VLFFASIVVVALILVPFSVASLATVSDFQARMPHGYRWPQLGDFWLTLVSAVVLGSLERAFEFFFYDSFYVICKEKNSMEERDRRTRKAVQNMYKTSYYLAATVLGYLTL